MLTQSDLISLEYPKTVVLKLFSWRPGKKNSKAATQCDRGGVVVVRNSGPGDGGGANEKFPRRDPARPGTPA